VISIAPIPAVCLDTFVGCFLELAVSDSFLKRESNKKTTERDRETGRDGVTVNRQR